MAGACWSSSPYIPVALDVRCTFALVSYADRLTIGITADAAALPDLDRLVDHVGLSLRELVGGLPLGQSRRICDNLTCAGHVTGPGSARPP